MNRFLCAAVVAAALLAGGCGEGDRTAESPTPLAKARSSQRLLAADRQAGRLGRETWLLYRAYALFGDDRLPAEYDGTGSEGEDATFVDDVRLAWPTLSQEAREALEPFIVRPNDPRSIFGPPARGAATEITPKAGKVRCATEWRSETGLYFRAWICPTSSTTEDDAALVTTLSLADALYPEMTQPVPDGMDLPVPDLADNDADAKTIDIYIVAPRQCRDRGQRCITIPGTAVAAAVSAPPYQGKTASGYLIVSSARLDGNLRSDLAHEFFHILQYAHNQETTYKTTTFPGPDGEPVTLRLPHWFIEASATWAEWQYVPETAKKEVHRRFINEFRLIPAVPLTSLEDDHEYASYIWPFFVQQERGGRDHPQPIFQMWEGIGNADSFNAVTDAIDGVFPFAKHFGDFAVRNYNFVLSGQPIKPLYRALDPNLPPSTTEAPPVTNAGMIRLASVPARDVDIEPLAVQYDEFDIAGNVRKVTFDFTGVANHETLTVDALVRDTLTQKYRRVKAVGGVLEFCRDKPGEDVDHVILVLGNSARREGDNRRITGAYDIARRNRCTCEGLEEPVAGRLRGSVGFSYAWVAEDANFRFDLNEIASSANFDFTEIGRTTVKPIVVNYSGTLRGGSVSIDDTVTEFGDPEDCVRHLEGSGRPHTSSNASLVVNYTTCEYHFESNVYVDGTITPTGCSSNPTAMMLAVGGVRSAEKPDTAMPLTGSGSFPALSTQQLAMNPNVEHYRVSNSAGSLMFATGTQQGQAGSASVSWNFFDPDAPPPPAR